MHGILNLIVVVLIILCSSGIAYCLTQMGHIRHWQYAGLAMAGCWLFIPGLLDQIRRNRISGRAAKTMSWVLQLTLILENLAWLALACATHDWVVYFSCLPGLFLGQWVLMQMFLSSGVPVSTGEMCIGAIFVFSIGIVAGGPISLDGHAGWLNWVATISTFLCIGGSICQYCVNKREGSLTGRDFSPWLAPAFIGSALTWFLYTYMDGKIGWPMYVSMSAIIAMYLTITAQVHFYRTRMSQTGGM